MKNSEITIEDIRILVKLAAVDIDTLSDSVARIMNELDFRLQNTII